MRKRIGSHRPNPDDQRFGLHVVLALKVAVQGLHADRHPLIQRLALKFPQKWR
jgi:hypothetical protein